MSNLLGQTGKTVDNLVIGGPQTAARQALFLIPLKIQQADGRMQFTHLTIDADGTYAIFIFDPEIAHKPQALRILSIFRGQQSPFEGVEKLRRVQGKHGQIPHSCHRCVARDRAKGMCRVKNQFQPMGVTKYVQCGVIAECSINMDANHCAGPFGDRALDGTRVERQRFRINIGEDRFEAAGRNGVGGRREGQRRGDYLRVAWQVQAQQSALQRRGTIAEQFCHRHTEKHGEFGFQLAAQRAFVGHYPAVPDIAQQCIDV